MLMTLDKPSVQDPAYRWGSALMLVATAAIVTALLFQYIGGYAPCELCVQQRWAYYIGIPATFLALIALSAGKPRVAGLLLFAIALGFLANAGLGVYHAGAEWKFWDGPQTCSGGTLSPLGGKSGGLLGNLDSVRIQRCDEASWRFAGLSFAGWNVVISFGLMVAGLKAAFASTDR